MRFGKSVVSSVVLVGLLTCSAVFTPAASAATPAAKPAAAKPAGKKPAAGKQVSGKQLLAESKKAVAGILKETKASGGKLDPKSKKQAPFFSGLKAFQAALEASEKQLKAKDKKLFASLSKGSTELAKVKTAWPRLGVTNAKVDGYLGKLDNSFGALRSRYGAEGLRAKQGKELSAKEKANFEKVKASQAEFSKKLAPMQAKAKQKGDKGMEAQLARLAKQCDKVAKAQATADAFLASMLLVDYIQGEWDAYSYYVAPDYRSDWVAMDSWVTTSFSANDTLYWETVDTYTIESWEYWEVTMELDDDLDFAVTDISDADLVSTDEYFDSSFTYDELSWEDYSTEYASAESDDVVYDEEDVNLDLAEESWEDEGLDMEAADDLLDDDDAAEAADDDDDDADDDGDDADDEGDDTDDEGDDAGDEGDDADDEGDDADDEGDDADDEGDDADDEGDDAGDEGDDAGDEGDDAGDEGDDAGDEGDDEELN